MRQREFWGFGGWTIGGEGGREGGGVTLSRRNSGREQPRLIGDETVALDYFTPKTDRNTLRVLNYFTP